MLPGPNGQRSTRGLKALNGSELSKILRHGDIALKLITIRRRMRECSFTGLSKT